MEYSDIFNGLFCNITTASLLLPVQDRIKDYFAKNDTVKDVSAPTAIPLAIGYYYNMLDKVEDLLKADNLILKEHKAVPSSDVLSQILSKEQIENQPHLVDQLSHFKVQETKNLGRFDYTQIKLKIVYPERLTNKNLRECSFYLNEKTRKASLESTVAGRSYGVNFIADDEDLSSITIVDYARPIEVIFKYFNEFKGYLDLEEPTNIWNEKIEQEMQAFLGTLKFLIDEKSSFLYRLTSTECISM